LVLEIGSDDFLLPVNSRPSDYAAKLRKQGSAAVLDWISCFVKGIIELQQLGLFHPDLTFRNTIKAKTIRSGDVFKIIDFDYAFKVKATEVDPRK
jgi:hypothetical protein